VESLTQKLQKILRNAGRVAVLGVGSELRGDDAAGIFIARQLDASCGRKRSRVKVFIGDTAPENLTGEIKRYKPTHIVIVDSADMGTPPGTIRLIDPDEVGGVTFCTHSLPLKVLTDYLRRSLECTIAIIGIQPKRLGFGSSVSKEVAVSLRRIERALRDIFMERQNVLKQPKKRIEGRVIV